MKLIPKKILLNGKESVAIYRMLVNCINEVNIKGQGNKWFSLFLVKNKNALVEEVERIERRNEQVQPTKGVIEFNDKRTQALLEYCLKDKYGKPVIISNNSLNGETNYSFDGIPEQAEKFREKEIELRKEYEKVLTDWEVAMNEFRTEIIKINEFELYTISFDLVPDNLSNTLFMEKELIYLEGTEEEKSDYPKLEKIDSFEN